MQEKISYDGPRFTNPSEFLCPNCEAHRRRVKLYGDFEYDMYGCSFCNLAWTKELLVDLMDRRADHADRND